MKSRILSVLIFASFAPINSSALNIPAPFHVFPEGVWTHVNGGQTQIHRIVDLIQVGPTDIGNTVAYGGWLTASTTSSEAVFVSTPLLPPFNGLGSFTDGNGETRFINSVSAAVQYGIGSPTLSATVSGIWEYVEYFGSEAHVQRSPFTDHFKFTSAPTQIGLDQYGMIDFDELYEILNEPTEIIEKRLTYTIGGLLAPPGQPFEKEPLLDPMTSSACGGRCLSCGDGPGAVNAQLNSVDLSISMGRVPGAIVESTIQIKVDRPNAEAFKPWRWGLESVSKVENASGNIVQLLSESAVVNLTYSATSNYDIVLTFFERRLDIALDGDGLYPVPINAEVLATVHVDDPAPQSETRTLRIRRTADGGQQTWTYSWIAPSNALALSLVSDAQTESESLIEEIDAQTGDRIETRSKSISGGAIVGETKSIYRTFPFGEKLIKRINDPNGRALETEWYYQQNVALNGHGEIQSIKLPSGYWEFYEYDALNRIVRTYSQIGNAVLPPYPVFTDCMVEDWEYSAYSEGPPAVPGMIRKIKYREGTEIARTFRVADRYGFDDVVCQNLGASWDHPTNLVTQFRYSPDSSGELRLKSVTQPNQIRELHDYEIRDANGDLTEDRMIGTTWIHRVDTGLFNTQTNSITAGSRRETQEDRNGKVIESKTTDLLSGHVLQHTKVVAFDDVGRPTIEEDLLTGRTNITLFGCCGTDSTTTYQGVTSTHAQSPGVTSTTQNGITKSQTISGLITIQTRKGTDNSEVELQRSTVNLAGEVVSSYSRTGGQVTYSRTISDGFNVETTTHADGGTRVVRHWQDGKVHSVIGTSVAPYRYETGTDANVTHAGLTFNSQWTKTIALDSAGQDTLEWTKTSTDMLGRTWKTENSAGSVTLTVYDGSGRPVKVVDPDQVITLFEYTPDGLATTTAIDLNQNSVIDYTGTDRISRSTTLNTTRNGIPVSRVTEQQWISGGDNPTVVRVSERSLDGLQTWITEGNLTTSTVEAPGPNGWDGNWTFSTLYPDNSTEVDTYAAGRLTNRMRRDANSVVFSSLAFEYDTHGRPWKQTDSRGALTITLYEQISNPVTGGLPVSGDLVSSIQTPPLSAQGPAPVTSYSYDAMGRAHTVTDPLNGTNTSTYYPTGQLMTTSGTRSYPVSYTYTPQGRISTMTTSSGVTTWEYTATTGTLWKKLDGTQVRYSLTYKPSGRLLTKTNARSLSATYGYNSGGDLVSVDYSDNTPDALYTYDRKGRRRILQALGSANLSLTFNAWDQTLSETISGATFSPASFSLQRTYDTLRRPTNRLLFRSSAPVVTSTSGYDSASRLKTVTSGASNMTYDYLPGTNWVTGVNIRNGTQVTGTVLKEFGLSGHLSQIATNAGGQPAISAAYELDQLGRREKTTREDGGFWSYGYNARSEVASASRFFSDQTAMALEQFSYTYDGIGNRLTAVSGGRRETHSVNSSNQVTSRTHNGRLTVTGEADPASNVVVEAQDARRAQRKGPLFWTELNLPLSTGGVYQPINIWSAKPNAGTGGADLIGKKTGVRFIYPSPESLTYDADGNLTGDARWSYGWDAENRLIWMEEHVNPTLAGSGLQRQRLEFAYDPLGRRVSKKVRAWNETTSTWVFQRRIVMVWDGWTLLAELESATETGTLVTRRSYVWGLDLASSPTATGGVGALLFAREHNTSGTLVATYTPCYDGNGNVMALMNVQTSAITARYEYDAFGNLLRSTGSKATWNPFRFSTKYEDRESGLLYYGYRYYSPELGRWVNRDPHGEHGGLNVYSMVGNQVLNTVDRLGLMPCLDKCNKSTPDLTDRVNEKVRSVFTDYYRIFKNGDIKGLRALLERKLIGGGDGIRTGIETYTNSIAQRSQFPTGAGIMKLCGRCVGSDKLGHFFEEGLIYYDIAYTHKLGERMAIVWGQWSEGISPGPITAAEWDWLQAPDITVNFAGKPIDLSAGYLQLFGPSFGRLGDHGLDLNGDASPADLAANLSGMQFWKQLMSGKLGKFDICNYVTDGWDHLQTPNIVTSPTPQRP